MRYEEPQKRARLDLEVDLSAASSDVVAAALVDAAHHGDAEWAQQRLLVATSDQRLDVARTALLGFGILARRGALRSDRRVGRPYSLVSITPRSVLLLRTLWRILSFVACVGPERPPTGRRQMASGSSKICEAGS